MCSRSESCSASRKASSSRIDFAVNCEMLIPPTVTANDSGLSRAPLHVRQGTSRMNCSRRSRWPSDSASAYLRSTTGMTPSYVVQYERVRPYRLRYVMWTSSSEPYRMACRASADSRFQGVLVLNRNASARPSSSRRQYSSREFDQGAMAPSSMESSSFGTTSSGSTSSRLPSPSQAGQAPYGELNEKFRGAGSSKEIPS